LPTPPTNRKTNRPRFLGRQLQPSRRGHWQSDDLADDSPEAAIAKTFLHRRQNILFPVGLGEHHTIRMETCLRKRREEEVGTDHTPEDLPLGPRGDSSNAESCRRTVDRPGSTAGKFVKRAIGKAAARQRCVDLGDPKGKTAGLFCRTALKGGDAVAQIGDYPVAGSSHRSRVL
jgi:hypothetical protein